MSCLPPRVLPTSQSSGAHLATSGLSVCLVMAPKSHICLWKEGRMIIRFTKRLFRNHALSLLHLLSYWSETTSFGSTAEPADRVPSPRAPAEPGMQLLSVVLLICSAETCRSLLCQGGGSSVCGLLQQGTTGHQAAPAVTGTFRFRDVAPGTELWVETLTYFHTAYHRIIRG